MERIPTPQKFISLDLLDKLSAAFPAPIVRPGMETELLMYKAGAHSVVEFIEEYLRREGYDTYTR